MKQTHLSYYLLSEPLYLYMYIAVDSYCVVMFIQNRNYESFITLDKALHMTYTIECLTLSQLLGLHNEVEFE